jgi:tetratricopeptide (TPR) repeat protein
MATSLMAMSRSAVAGDLLLEAVAEAIEDGADQNQPVLRDSLSILFLAFEAQGRGEELKALFKPPETAPEAAPDGQEPSPSAQAPVQAPSAAQAGDAPDSQASRPEPSTDQADPPEDRTPPEPPPEPGQAPTIDQKEARELIERLKAGHPGSRVLPALALALAGALTDQARPPCRSPYPAGHYDELLSLCLDVAKGYASVKELNESSVILDSLTRAGLTALAEKEDVSKPRLIEALALLASEREALNDPASAEAALRQAREVAAAMPKDDQQTLTSLIILSLRLSDVIIKQRRPPIEAELELVTGLTIIKKIFGARIIESHPLIPVIYLRLAWLVESLGRGKDAGAYRNQAGRSIKAVTKAHPEFKVTIDELNQAFEESRRGESSQDTLAHLWRSVLPADRPPLDPPSPELMRVELAALKLLNRLPEFRPLIDSAIQWSAGTHGPDSSTHRRYQSLNLKYLEESGDLPALLAALDGLAADPGTTKDPERTAIITAALKYKARVLEAAGRVNEALEALSQARMMLLSNQALINRLPEIEAEINRLNAAD